MANPQQRKLALETLNQLFSKPEHCDVVHYSCGSITNSQAVSSPRIVFIALRNLGSAQTSSFSIQEEAEFQGIPLTGNDESVNACERAVLQKYFRHISHFQDRKYLHWNMRDSMYGFEAIEHRYRLLCNEEVPYVIEDSRKFDLSRLLFDIYGDGFIDHPRLGQLILKNNITSYGFLSGEKEAEAYGNQDFVAMKRSTLRKTQVIEEIAKLACQRTLLTNLRWWSIRGGRLYTVLNNIKEHPVPWAILALFTIIGGVVGAIQWRSWSLQ